MSVAACGEALGAMAPDHDPLHSGFCRCRHSTPSVIAMMGALSGGGVTDFRPRDCTTSGIPGAIDNATIGVTVIAPMMVRPACLDAGDCARVQVLDGDVGDLVRDDWTCAASMAVSVEDGAAGATSARSTSWLSCRRSCQRRLSRGVVTASCRETCCGRRQAALGSRLPLRSNGSRRSNAGSRSGTIAARPIETPRMPRSVRAWPGSTARWAHRAISSTRKA